MTNNIKTETVRVTPKMAEDWLNKHNSENRPVSDAVVKKYSEDMKAHRWQLNGEPIIFGTDGRLLNGQHRLFACMEADCAFDTIVIRGITNDAFRTLDSGKNRSSGDALFLMGHTLYSKRLAASAKACWLYENTNVYGEHNVNRQNVLDYVSKNKELIEFVSMTSSVKSAVSGFSTPISAVSYLASYNRDGDAREFVKGLIHGAGLEDGDPRLTLRNVFIREAAHHQRNSLRFWDRLSLTVMAWNGFSEGRKLTKIVSPRRAEFPRINGAAK